MNRYISRQLSCEAQAGDREQAPQAYAADKAPSESQAREYLHWLATRLNDEDAIELLIEHMQPRWLNNWRQRWTYRLIHSVVAGFVFGLMWGAVSGLVWGVRVGLVYGFGTGLKYGVVGAVVGTIIVSLLGAVFGILVEGLLFGLLFGATSDIVLPEAYRFSISRAKREKSLQGLISGIIGASLRRLRAGFHFKTRPNQGIWAAIIDVPLIIGISYPSSALVFYLLISIQGGDGRLSTSLVAGISIALLIGFFLGGGLAVAKHFALRIVLTMAGKIPWNYARFLNYCVERQLLQRIGGSYRFIHRELQTHFAQDIALHSETLK